MLKFLKFIFILIAFYSYPQNKSYKVIYDEIYPLLSSDYPKAKEIWLKMEKTSKLIDPVEMELILGYSLKNNDIKFFKKRIVFLMKNYGWNYNQNIDTLFLNIENNFLKNNIKKSNLNNWISIKSNKIHSKWKKNHPLNSFFIERVSQLKFCDQEITKILADNNGNEEARVILDSFIYSIDYNHILEIVKLCKLNNNVLLNNFDCGVGTYNKVNLILWHNLKSKINFQRSWDQLLPFIENAYFQNKISYTIFMAYDKWCNYHFENQYYGTLEGVKIKDLETFNERKKKYNL